MNRRFTYLGLVASVGILSVSLFSGCAQSQNRTDEQNSAEDNSKVQTLTIPVEERQPAPSFTYSDYAGGSVSLEDFNGTPVVVNSWATWCSFCKKELPDFAQVQQEFGDEVVYIAINRAEDIGAAKGYTDQQGTTDGLLFLLDPEDTFYRMIGGFAMPETLFIDSTGAVAEHRRGVLSLEEARGKTAALVEESKQHSTN